jgi:mRNA-degrading endonuclease YafQ of YafQ-DinJ toxin-antitoxin module
VETALRLFMDQPFHSRLKNHALSGHLQGLRAISAGYDLRIIYESEGGGQAREDHACVNPGHDFRLFMVLSL